MSSGVVKQRNKCFKKELTVTVISKKKSGCLAPTSMHVNEAAVSRRQKVQAEGRGKGHTEAAIVCCLYCTCRILCVVLGKRRPCCGMRSSYCTCCMDSCELLEGGGKSPSSS